MLGLWKAKRPPVVRATDGHQESEPAGAAHEIASPSPADKAATAPPEHLDTPGDRREAAIRLLAEQLFERRRS